MQNLMGLKKRRIREVRVHDGMHRQVDDARRVDVARLQAVRPEAVDRGDGVVDAVERNDSSPHEHEEKGVSELDEFAEEEHANHVTSPFGGDKSETEGNAGKHGERRVPVGPNRFQLLRSAEWPQDLECWCIEEDDQVMPAAEPHSHHGRATVEQEEDA